MMPLLPYRVDAIFTGELKAKDTAEVKARFNKALKQNGLSELNLELSIERIKAKKGER